jgi:hypothetical protein
VSAGLYSGVSGLALGIGLYRGVNGLWGGASGLIDGFGGGGPFPGASLYLNMLSGSLDSRVTFSRGSNATLVDNTGRITYAPANLLLHSGDYSNAAYGITSGVTFSGQTATFTSTGYRYQAFTLGSPVVGRTYIASVVLSSATKANILLRLNGNATGSDQATSLIALTPTPTRYWVIRTFTSSDTSIDFGLDNRAVVGGSGIAGDLVATDWQLEQVTYQTVPGPYVATTSAAYYGPRFDYNPVTLAPLGLLIEEARTNLLLRSQDFTTTWSTASTSTVVANSTIAPDGTLTADTVIPTATPGNHYVVQSVTRTAGSYTYTFYAKPAGYNFVAVQIRDLAGTFKSAEFNLSTGTVVASTSALATGITNAGNGWYRCTFVFDAGTGAGLPNDAIFIGSAAGTWNSGFTGNGTSGVFLYGAQLEAGSFATSYIPTVGSTVLRNADVATMTGTNFTSWFNPSVGTFVSDADAALSGVTRGIVGNVSGIYPSYVRSTNAGAIFDGGNIAATANSISTAPFKLATTYSVSLLEACLQGGAVASTTYNGNFGGMTSIAFGSTGAGAGFLNGHIRQIAYFNTRLPNAQLQALTAPPLTSPLFMNFTTGSYTVGY